MFDFLCVCRCLEASMTDVERETAERSRADRSLFVQELVLTTLSDEPQPQTRSELKIVCGTVARDFPQGLESVVPKRPTARGRPQAPPPALRSQAPAPAPTRHHSGTGTIREVVPPTFAGTTRRKPIRPVQTSEPPPSH